MWSIICNKTVGKMHLCMPVLVASESIYGSSPKICGDKLVHKIIFIIYIGI